MKSNINRRGFIPVLVLCAITCSAHAQILQDDFNGSAINTSLWNTSTPFSDSSIMESGGYAVFQNRGRLSTVPPIPLVLDITGSFAFVGNIHDSFQIDTRTDGTSVDQYGGFNSCVQFGFTIQNDLGQTTSNIAIAVNISGDTNYVQVGRGTYALALDTFYNFRITDDGTNVALYIGNLTTPLLTGSTSLLTGDGNNSVGMCNREGTGGGSSISAGSIVDLDQITIVPEPSTIALVTGALSCLLVASRRHP